jgi:hypothetical protein
MKYIVLILGLLSSVMNAMEKKEEETIQLDEMPLDFEKKDNLFDFKENVLARLPIFEGKTKEEVQQTMSWIKNLNAQTYGEINQMISYQQKTVKRSFDIKPEEITAISDKIQFELLTLTVENQKAAIENRKEDLAQAAKDRKRSLAFFFINLATAAPGVVLGIIAIAKAFN